MEEKIMPEIPKNDPAAGENHSMIILGIRKSSTVLKTISNFSFSDIHRSGYQLLLIYIAALSVLELSSYQFRGIFSIISSRIWLLGGLFCLVAVLYYFIQSIISDIQDKEYLPVLGTFLLILFLILLIGNVNLTEINPDAAQQAASGMASFKQSDLNYTGKAFLGYPNRQYIITAIPAFFFGRSITTLQLGFALPFILGMILLTAV
jgi:asparagine N-glycosylation enzyme membrane subunit Stt3